MKAVQHLPAGYREIYAIDMNQDKKILIFIMDVIARSEATRQSVLFAAAQNEKQHFGRIRKALRICPKDYQFAKFLCGDADCHVAGRLPRSSQ